MPGQACPVQGNKPAPQNTWSGKTWNELIDFHLEKHNTGGDTKIGFDDDDKLCVVQYGKRGAYAKRIPAALQDWTEQEIKNNNIIPLPNNQHQLRVHRGPGGSRESTEVMPGRDQLVAYLVEQANISLNNVVADDLHDLFRGNLFNMDFGDAMPVRIAQLESGGIAYGYVLHQKNPGQNNIRWTIQYGTIEDSHDCDGISVEKKESFTRNRGVSGGYIYEETEKRVMEYVRIDSESIRNIQNMLRTHLARESNVNPQDLKDLFQGPVINMEFGNPIPAVKLIPLANAGFAYGYVEQKEGSWSGHYGTIERGSGNEVKVTHAREIYPDKAKRQDIYELIEQQVKTHADQKTTGQDLNIGNDPDGP